MSRRATMALCTLLAACSAGTIGDGAEPSEEDSGQSEGHEDVAEPPEEVEALADVHGANDYVIHVGGICSIGFVSSGGSKKGAGSLGSWPGFVSIDAPVDQRTSMGEAVADLRAVFDAHCLGESWCHVYAYSNGAAVVSKTLSVYDGSRWNIAWVLASAGNEGGSELSASSVADLGKALGTTCELARHIGPSDLRPAWNHDDTGGHVIYHAAGYDEWWYTGGFPDFFGASANDGAVAYHSSAGLREPYHLSDDEPWLCYAKSAHYDGHKIAYDCRGFDRDHHAMKMHGIALMGG